eukprot:Skav224992  [mRNA]  locus=scaffold373:32709:39847:- [translate_table: standard]
MSLFGPWAGLARFTTLNDAVTFFNVPGDAWTAFENQVGDFQGDLRFLAALPRAGLLGGISLAQLPDGSKILPVTATQIGLVWRLSKRVMAFQGGINENDFEDVDPWEDPSSSSGNQATVNAGSSGVKDKILKMSNLIDQGDDSELLPPSSGEISKWLQQYLAVMGAMPEESEEPSPNQLAGLAKRVFTKMIWHRTQISLSVLRVSDLAVDLARRAASLNVTKSKMDQKAKGVRRTLRCCGHTTCLRECPVSLATRILADHTQFSEQAPLFPDNNGTMVPKVRMVKAWMDVLDPEISGHSARRTGAMLYARLGTPLHEIAMLGRWKSSAVFRYGEEALQDIPLNNHFGGNGSNVMEAKSLTHPFPPVQPGGVPVREQTVKHSKPVVCKPQIPEQFWVVSNARKGRVSHRVRDASWNLDLSRWSTWCGWHFAERNVKVSLSPKLLQGTVKCKKCEQARELRDDVKGGVSLAQIMALPKDTGK